MARIRWGAALLVLLTLAGCRSEEAGPPAAAADAGPPPAPPVVVRADSAGLLFRYYDPEARQMKSARRVEDVPAVARARVIVHVEKDLLDYRAGEPLTVADLRTPGADGTYPTETVDPYAFESALPTAERPVPAAAPAPGGAPSGAAAVAGVSADDVILFSADWCPHCRRAREYLKGRGVRFTERDVEKDPKARPLLAKLGQAAGVDPALLGSVPVLWVKGRLLLGFDEAEVGRLLGP